MSYRNLTELKVAVEENGGVLTVSVENVRNAHGAERLGSKVREAIIERLKSLGLEHRPQKFPYYQESNVRFFLKDSPAGRLILAAERLGSSHDKRLRAAARGEEVMEQIRELIGA